MLETEKCRHWRPQSAIGAVTQLAWPNGHPLILLYPLLSERALQKWLPFAPSPSLSLSDKETCQKQQQETNWHLKEKTSFEQRRDVDTWRLVSGLLNEKFAGQSTYYLQSQATQTSRTRCKVHVMFHGPDYQTGYFTQSDKHGEITPMPWGKLAGGL